MNTSQILCFFNFVGQKTEEFIWKKKIFFSLDIFCLKFRLDAQNNCFWQLKIKIERLRPRHHFAVYIKIVKWPLKLWRPPTFCAFSILVAKRLKNLFEKKKIFFFLDIFLLKISFGCPKQLFLPTKDKNRKIKT